MPANIEVIDTNVTRHEAQIADINHRLNELADSHKEALFMLKTLMENQKVRDVEFGEKIDRLSLGIEALKPSKADWEFEKRLEAIEVSQKSLLKYKTPGMIVVGILIIAVLAPEALPPLLDALQKHTISGP